MPPPPRTQAVEPPAPASRILGPGEITKEQTLAVACPRCAAERNQICRGGIQHPPRYAAAAHHFTMTGRSPRCFTPKRRAALALMLRDADSATIQRIRDGKQDSQSRRTGRTHQPEDKPWLTRLHPLDAAKSCLACNRPIGPGSNYAVTYDPATRTRVAYHPECAT